MARERERESEMQVNSRTYGVCVLDVECDNGNAARKSRVELHQHPRASQHASRLQQHEALGIAHVLEEVPEITEVVRIEESEEKREARARM